MIPGMNPRKMQQMMKKMGIAQQDLPVTRVIMVMDDKELVFDSPSVQRVNMMGQQTFQLSGQYEERALETIPEIHQDDIDTVKAQVEKTDEQIRLALERNKGDIAQTILDLSR